MNKRKILLLTRDSPFQRYCAGILFSRGILSTAFVEEGISFPTEKRLLTLKKGWGALRSHPGLVFQKLMNKMNHPKYYGAQENHVERLLGKEAREWPKALDIVRVKDLNDPETVSLVKSHSPDLVFVFGTQLLKPPLFESKSFPVVNMHWGWSPDYRGEGIVTALALGGVKDLGVTVHLIDPGSDSGDILYRSRLEAEKGDNFFSLGLKATKAGTMLFCKVAEDLLSQGILKGERQSLSQGRLYSKKYMREHPELLPLAWERLQKEVLR